MILSSSIPDRGRNLLLLAAPAASLLGLLLVLAASCTWAAPPVTITQSDSGLRVDIGGKLFTKYHVHDTPRPYFYPLIGPEGTGLTRGWPMEQTEGENRDHPHHRSFWIGHGKVNGQDLWQEENRHGRIAHLAFDAIETNRFICRNEWRAHNDGVLCTDRRTYIFHPLPGGQMLVDIELVLEASNGEVVFGDTKEGFMALRVAPTIKVNNESEGGCIVNSEGLRDKAAWGHRADWCDYHGPDANGRLVGMALFDHPANPRHPTWWHVRDYGLFAANPFGAHHFERKPKGTGDFRIPEGKSATFRYRLYIHKGNEQTADVAGRYRAYAAETVDTGTSP